MARIKHALIRSQHVFDRHFDSTGLAFISEAHAKELRNAEVQSGDILLNITGDGITFGRSCQVPDRILPACVNQHVAIIRPDRSECDPGNLLAVLTHPATKAYIESFNSGGSRRAITKGHIESFEIPLPPIDEQRVIATVLGAMDDKIELNRRMNATLESMARVLFQSWFVDFDPVLGEADGKYSGDLAKWNQAGEFYATLARWVAGKHQPLPEDMYLAQEVRDGVCFVQLHLDPERTADPFSNLPQVKVLHGVPGATPTKSTVALGWKNADLMEAAIPITGRETVLNTVEIAGQQAVTLPPVCLPYSPEYAPGQPGRGAAALAQIAATTGGKDRVEIPKIWGELPVKSRYVELAPWLLVVAAALFLLEVFERRTGGVSKLVLARRSAGGHPPKLKQKRR